MTQQPRHVTYRSAADAVPAGPGQSDSKGSDSQPHLRQHRRLASAPETSRPAMTLAAGGPRRMRGTRQPAAMCPVSRNPPTSRSTGITGSWKASSQYRAYERIACLDSARTARRLAPRRRSPGASCPQVPRPPCPGDARQGRHAVTASGAVAPASSPSSSGGGYGY